MLAYYSCDNCGLTVRNKRIRYVMLYYIYVLKVANIDGSLPLYYFLPLIFCFVMNLANNFLSLGPGIKILYDMCR